MIKETLEFRIYADGTVYYEGEYGTIPEDASDDYKTTIVVVADDGCIFGDMSSLLSLKSAGFEYNFPQEVVDAEDEMNVASQLTIPALNAVNASASYNALKLAAYNALKLAAYKPPLGEVFDLSPEDELALPDIQRGMCIAFEYLDRYLDLCIHLDDDLYPDKFLADFHSRRDKLRVDHFPLSAKETVGLFTFFLRNCPQIEMIKHLPSTELHEMASGKGEAI